jgi:hypothetical protein
MRSGKTGRHSVAGNDKTSLILQERDLKLLEALETMRAIDREQTKIVGGFSSTTRVNTRLLALTRAGFLRRAFIGNRQAVYWLAATTRSEPSQRELLRHEPTSLYLRHRLEVNKVHLLLKYRTVPITGWWFVRWQSVTKNLSPAVPLIPDGYFEVRSAAGVRASFLEVDLGTEALPVFHRKVQLYLQLAASGEFSTLFHQPQFRVLVVANSARRLASLRQTIAGLTDKIFWLTTLESINHDRFWSAVWLRPTGDQMQPLL